MDKTGGRAFPGPASDELFGPSEGMTLRDYFAGQAFARYTSSKSKLRRNR